MRGAINRTFVFVGGAVGGRRPENFRNLDRSNVKTIPAVLSLRIDECLYFASTQYLDDLVLERSAANPDLRYVILMCSTVKGSDLSALEMLERLDQRLRDTGVALHLSEVKWQVMDRLRRGDLLDHLFGHVFVWQFEAWCKLIGLCQATDPLAHARR